MLGTIIGVITGFLGGGTLSYFLWDKALKAKKVKIVTEAEAEGEVIKKEKMLQAREKYLQLKSEHESQVSARNSKLQSMESSLKQKELKNLFRRCAGYNSVNRCHFWF